MAQQGYRTLFIGTLLEWWYIQHIRHQGIQSQRKINTRKISQLNCIAAMQFFIHHPSLSRYTKRLIITPTRRQIPCHRHILHFVHLPLHAPAYRRSAEIARMGRPILATWARPGTAPERIIMLDPALLIARRNSASRDTSARTATAHRMLHRVTNSMRFVADQSNDHTVQVEEKHQKVET